jgi:hypothetical protein
MVDIDAVSTTGRFPMQHLLRTKGPRSYGALMLFLLVYLAALGLILAPKGSLTSPAIMSETQAD